MTKWSVTSSHVMFQVVSLEAGEMAKLPEQTDGAKEPYPVPKELWFLCDIMTSLGLSKENLFLQVRKWLYPKQVHFNDHSAQPGLRSEILQLRDWLDTGLPQVAPDRSNVVKNKRIIMIRS